ncbi:hypothetical protein AMIS_41080 [Actinoplanes missouriensis 431]|uniref:Lipoprotein n=1 Tax=Actinoplanes missouriensis (strain ATCC 14538 / DSM 43046 / CBS 188.64 / JCM 3121 / NBRC 102363 / NCIMB 12654 / NRRL B-3342 / UNCC 431) TaxID=512565 RepID=I0H8J1_ACTM4|nr:lipoprotein [Actinoplanes missouriensis]BAL89328.1 hypothetical protein AMIS_41080 [Actinoplanes missouriensis 431]
MKTAGAALMIMLVTGCSAGPPAQRAVATSVPAGGPSAAGPSTAPPGDDSQCDLPVTFDIADGWTTKAIDVSTISDKVLAGMFRTGPFDTICSVNGKPAGVDGFVRVYFSDIGAGNPRDNLKVYVHTDTLGPLDEVKYEVRAAKYRDLTIAGTPAAEVTWNRRTIATKASTRYTAFSLDTPKGTVIVVLMPFTTKDYADVLPAYELARSTLTVNP